MKSIYFYLVGLILIHISCNCKDYYILVAKDIQIANMKLLNNAYAEINDGNPMQVKDYAIRLSVEPELFDESNHCKDYYNSTLSDTRIQKNFIARY